LISLEKRGHRIRSYPNASQEKVLYGNAGVAKWTWNRIQIAYRVLFDEWQTAGSPEPELSTSQQESIDAWKAEVETWKKAVLAAHKASVKKWKALGRIGTIPEKPKMPRKPKFEIDRETLLNRPHGEKPSIEVMKLQFNVLRETFAPWTSKQGHRDCWSQPFDDFATAIQRWNADKDIGFPNIKKRTEMPAFYVANDKFHIIGKNLHLPKLKKPIRLAEELRFDGKITGLRVTRDASLRWHAAVSMSDVSCPNRVRGTEIIGIDLGVKTALTYSTGETFTPPYERQSEEKKKSVKARMRRIQRGLSRKYEVRKKDRVSAKSAGDTVLVKKLQKPSMNEKRQRQVLNKLHAKQHDQLADWQHKLTTATSRRTSPGTLGIESVSPKAWMMAKRGWSEKLAHAGLGELRRQYVYKCEPVLFPASYPSSQLCCVCDNRQKMPLSVRVFNCVGCGAISDRDLNAANRLKPTTQNLKYIENMFVIKQSASCNSEQNAPQAMREVRETTIRNDLVECSKSGFVPVAAENANRQVDSQVSTC